MRRAARVAWLEPFRELDLLRLQSLGAEHRGPRDRGVAAVQELLVDGLVTAPAIPRREACHDREAMMVLPLLPSGRLVAVEAGDALPCVPAHLVFVHDRVLLRGVALGALAGRP